MDRGLIGIKINLHLHLSDLPLQHDRNHVTKIGCKKWCHFSFKNLNWTKPSNSVIADDNGGYYRRGDGVAGVVETVMV